MEFVINKNRNLDFHIIRKFVERRYRNVNLLAEDLAEFFKNMTPCEKERRLISIIQKKIVCKN